MTFVTSVKELYPFCSIVCKAGGGVLPEEHRLPRVEAARCVELFETLRTAAEQRLAFAAADGVQISAVGEKEHLPLLYFARKAVAGGEEAGRDAERLGDGAKRLPAFDAVSGGRGERKFHASTVCAASYSRDRGE